MKEILFAVILVALLVLLLNPFSFWMPDSWHMMLLIGIVVVFALFALFGYREKASDEREVLHRFIAGRFAYLLGTGTLVIGIVFETLNHTYNSWLIVTLIVMVVAKMGGILYGNMKY